MTEVPTFKGVPAEHSRYSSWNTLKLRILVAILNIRPNYHRLLSGNGSSKQAMKYKTLLIHSHTNEVFRTESKKLPNLLLISRSKSPETTLISRTKLDDF